MKPETKRKKLLAKVLGENPKQYPLTLTIQDIENMGACCFGIRDAREEAGFDNDSSDKVFLPLDHLVRELRDNRTLWVLDQMGDRDQYEEIADVLLADYMNCWVHDTRLSPKRKASYLRAIELNLQRKRDDYLYRELCDLETGLGKLCCIAADGYLSWQEIEGIDRDLLADIVKARVKPQVPFGSRAKSLRALKKLQAAA